MPLKRVWRHRQWRSVHVNLDGTYVMPQECECLGYGKAVDGGIGRELVWDPLNCPIDDHGIRYRQAEDPEALRDRLYPWIDWKKLPDWQPEAEIAGAPALVVLEVKPEVKTKMKGAA